MPSVAQNDASPTAPSSKKRRRDDNHQITLPHSAVNIPRSISADKTALGNGGLFEHLHSSAPVFRRTTPLPPGKRNRTTVDIDIEGEGEPMQRSPTSSPPQRNHLQQREQHSAARHASRELLDEKTRTPAASASASLTSRCHICSRKPTKKSDLDSFADCQGCGQRTCYVCIRECLGWEPNIPPIASTIERVSPNPPPTACTPATTTTTTTTSSASPSEEGDTSFTMLDADAAEDRHHPHHHPPPTEATTTGLGGEDYEQGWARGGGHRQVVCSRCCVEKGADGDVVCLGCLPFVEG
ncbi:hypothetical protein N658DRAFT_503680 [Parathielavia hyrcaniae]|uniref:Uncharacterized protein n=1 Tax=Parathielavia hyrcaniae TaxID=113614 RepID=A0AAN6Q8E9_9PEZI|nr:hypothetical protein N658DRAFT_503680 [Parathielavia hyrcaniae]